MVQRGERDNPRSSHGAFALPVKRKSPFHATCRDTLLQVRLNSHLVSWLWTLFDASGAIGRSSLGLADRERAWVVAPRSRRNPNSCRGVGARIVQGRDGRDRGRTELLETSTSAAAAVHRFVGIEVSKALLDVALRPRGEDAWRSTNDAPGITELVRRLKRLAPHLIVLEATGGLERLVVAALALAALPVAVATPRQVRDFAKATGRLAKTDALDAAALAHWRTLPRPSTPSRAPCLMPSARRSPPWSRGATRWWAC
jgi:Transposase